MNQLGEVALADGPELQQALAHEVEPLAGVRHRGELRGTVAGPVTHRPQRGERGWSASWRRYSCSRCPLGGSAVAGGSLIRSSSVRVALCGGLVLGVIVGGTSCGQLVRGHRPQPIVGRWADATRTTRGDTLVWRLSAVGDARLDLSARGDLRTEVPDRSDSRRTAPAISILPRHMVRAPAYSRRPDGRALPLLPSSGGGELRAVRTRHYLDRNRVDAETALGRPGTRARTTRILLQQVP